MFFVNFNGFKWYHNEYEPSKVKNLRTPTPKKFLFVLNEIFFNLSICHLVTERDQMLGNEEGKNTSSCCFK